MDLKPALNRALFLGTIVLLAAACGEEAPQPPTADSPVEQVQKQQPDISAVLAVHRAHTTDLMKIPGVVGTGLAVNVDRPTIPVYVMHGDVRGVPDHVENVPVERVVTGLIIAGGVRAAADPNDPTTRERPAPNGFSVGHPDITAGTLGAVVRDAADVCSVLSNNHVLANSNDASIGDSALQPGPFDGGTDPADAIGTLADFEPIAFDGSNNTIDAAIAAVFSTADVTGSTPDYAYGAPGTSTVNASVGMDVMKFGRTTGFTTGDVAETNVTVDVCYETRGPFSCVSLARFVGQFTVTPGDFSAGGDSGSLIVRASDASPVGLLFAGSSTRTIANPIDDVLSRFGVSIESNLANCGGGGTTNLPPTSDFTFSVNGLTVDFTDQSFDTDGNVIDWSWDFGDGNGSSDQNPTHTYAASGTFNVTLTVTDDGGAQDGSSQNVTVDDGGPGGDFTLSVTGYKVRGVHHADLTWDGATSSQVDIIRDGALVTTTANDGFHTDNIGARGGATYVYQVCEAGASTCSNEATATP